MISSSSFYTRKIIDKREQFFKKRKSGKNISTSYFLECIINKALEVNPKKILDLGTGNGFVIMEVARKLPQLKNTEFIGVDFSKPMVEKARKNTKNDSRITILRADNFNLPFPNESINIVTDKNTTNISLPELYRVLVRGGWFFFKEYGLGKGIKEIATLFPGRVKTKDPLDYIFELRALGFNYIKFEQFFFVEKKSFEEIKKILEIAPIIKNFSPKKDLHLIKETLFQTGNFTTITSEPFVICAQK
ncbi:class I SAM-dependent methyltransferase [Patescibacteria group bacterium]|nr:class I SAM-dependent methyltransferase [Patescibacteria group bacterium]